VPFPLERHSLSLIVFQVTGPEETVQYLESSPLPNLTPSRPSGINLGRPPLARTSLSSQIADRPSPSNTPRLGNSSAAPLCRPPAKTSQLNLERPPLASTPRLSNTPGSGTSMTLNHGNDAAYLEYKRIDYSKLALRTFITGVLEPYNSYLRNFTINNVEEALCKCRTLDNQNDQKQFADYIRNNKRNNNFNQTTIPKPPTVQQQHVFSKPLFNTPPKPIPTEQTNT